MDIYSRYAPFIREHIYRNNWQSLRGIQVAAGDAIFNTDENVLLTASTAAGKTEAAMFPILTLMEEDPPLSVGCLYIAPLKALINDQFGRVEELCSEADITVMHWHGDVSQDRKRKFLKAPRGILQITPESLEAMMMRRHQMIGQLFGDLRFIVIDEVHSFLRGDRGLQTVCLVQRLMRDAGISPRIIGLSATIGSPEAAARIIAAGTGRGTVIPKVKEASGEWRISMEHFYITGPQAGEGEPSEYDPSMKYIYDRSQGRKCLVFSNSREECEAVTVDLRTIGELSHEPERFLIHHGNLSTAYRESAEDIIKEDDKNVTICTTSTLELGIDIGRLERAFQINAPFTVSSFLQRMGRTGRRGNPAEMLFVMREERAGDRDDIGKFIPWSLLQGIALVQLYIEERWVEPPREGRLPFSLLYHQAMSILSAEGDMQPAELASRLLTLSPFANISQEDLKVLLRHLVKEDQLEITETGGLLVGIKGERVINDYRFFAVFQENVEYSVRCESSEIGTIAYPPKLNEDICIAGKVWRVTDTNIKEKKVYVMPVKGKVPAYFGDVAGDIDTRVLLRMKKALGENDIYPYLLNNAKVRLEEARHMAREASLTERPLHNIGPRMYILFPWLGSYAFLALSRLIQIKCAKRLGLTGFISAKPYYMQFIMKESEDGFYEILKEEAERLTDPMELLFPKEVPVFEKYDAQVPPELVRKSFAYGVLDIGTMKERIREWPEPGTRSRYTVII